jgi:hypothetical protein
MRPIPVPRGRKWERSQRQQAKSAAGINDGITLPLRKERRHPLSSSKDNQYMTPIKHHFALLASAIVAFTLLTARAQPGPPQGPNFDAALVKLFGDNSGFSATIEIHSSGTSGNETTMTGNTALLDGNSRFEMDLSNMQGGHIPPQAAARMKQMGMSKIIVISRRDKNLSYMIYPDMQAYMERPAQSASAAAADYKSEVTKLGEETIDGHACVKNKVVVTAPDGATHESTVWNATDLKQFPLKIQSSEHGMNTVMLFKDVKLDKPDAAQFDPPADFKKYDNMMSLMMSRAGGAPK